MDARIWLVTNRITMKKFCQDISSDYQYMSNVLCGRRRPGEKLILKILSYTRGEVTRRDMLRLMKKKEISNE